MSPQDPWIRSTSAVGVRPLVLPLENGGWTSQLQDVRPRLCAVILSWDRVIGAWQFWQVFDFCSRLNMPLTHGCILVGVVSLQSIFA